MNIIQKLIETPMQRNILKCCSILGKHRMLPSVVLPERYVHKSSSGIAGNVKEVDLNNQPVKYTASAAGKFRAKASLKEDDERLWYEPYVVIGSLTIFLTYFLILREENDLDEEIFMPLHERISGLEEVQLKSLIEHSKNPEEVESAELRLEEIRKQ